MRCAAARRTFPTYSVPPEMAKRIEEAQAKEASGAVKGETETAEMAALRAKASQGDAEACYTLGLKLLQDFRAGEAVKHLRAAHAKGHPTARLPFFTALLESQDPKLNSEGVALLETESSNGCIQSKLLLGTACVSGTGCEVNLKKAEVYFKEAAEAGSDKGMLKYSILRRQSGEEGSVEEANSYLERAAERGNADALAEYGLLQMMGKDYPQNKEKGARVLQQTIDMGCVNGLFYFGLYHLDVANDKKKALELLRQAADKGHLMAQIECGKLLKHEPDGIKYLRQAARAGSIEACLHASDLLRETNAAEAIELLRLGAAKGHPVAQYNVSLLLHSQGSKEAAQEAAMWLERAAAALPEAQVAYGSLLKRGSEVVDRNLFKAAEMMKKAAEAGNTDGMVFFAHMLGKGEGVEKDIEQADQWIERAATAGNAWAMYNWAFLLAGQGKEEEAGKVLVESASKGCIPAMVAAAKRAEGNGDITEARKWFERASSTGDAASMLAYAAHLRMSSKPEDTEAMKKLVYMAAEKGHPFGLYAKATLVDDRQERMALLEQAAKMNVSEAQVELGKLLVAKDPHTAARWFSVAAEGGNPMAMQELAKLYYEGTGVEKDADLGKKWLDRAEEILRERQGQQ
eukprot:Sspe_Gene.17316::Locus_6142_Transcript_1_1_Confidence_1.000_Length_1920::g.17316::m.17316/K07126/K07126; uncharacterized protein